MFALSVVRHQRDEWPSMNRRCWNGRRCSCNHRRRGIQRGHGSYIAGRRIENAHLTRPCIECVDRIVHIDDGGQGCLGRRDYRRMSCSWIDLVDSAGNQRRECSGCKVRRQGGEIGVKFAACAEEARTKDIY